MNSFEKIIYWLQGTMERPNPFGWFHLMWIAFTIIAILFLYKQKNKFNEKQLKMVLLIYGVIAFILELIKQIIWSYNYNSVTEIGTWQYEWYAAPFQLCTTPIFVSLICACLKKNKLRDSLLSYMAYITILGSFMTIIIPDSCFVETIEVNIHTMWLHCGSFVVSVYLLLVGEVELKFKNIKNAFLVFIMFATIAEVLNISIYHSGILQGETFNMFYISPYFISSLPVFNIIQENVPFILFLLFYITAIFLGSLIIYFISLGIRKILYYFKSKIM